MQAAHQEKHYTIFQIAMNLAAACLIAGIIIAAVYYVTAPIAAQKNVEMKEKAMKALVKDAESFKAVEGKTEWYAAQNGGKTIAYVVPGESKGFGGAIKMLIAVSTDGKVLDYTILSHNETPGLGDKAAVAPFKTQFVNKVAEHLKVVKDPSDKEDIQAMTGATISSNAVTKGVKEALEEVVKFTGGK